MNIRKYIKIVKKTQAELKSYTALVLRQQGYDVTVEDGFVYAKGDMPVMLVAHLDTVHILGPRNIYMSLDQNKIKADEGIGGDDRNGVYMILEIIKKVSYKPHILFTEDEETGGIGATKFTKSNIKPDLNFIIELDRRGSNDAVFYECDNEDFTKFIEDFGWVTSIGSFSDISYIAPELEVAAVNLSCGYEQAHTNSETVYLDVIDDNIERVIEILDSQMNEETKKKFEYVEMLFSYNRGGYYYWNGRSYTYVSYNDTTSDTSNDAYTNKTNPRHFLCEYCSKEIACGEDQWGYMICEHCAETYNMVKCEGCGLYFYREDTTIVDGKRLCKDCDRPKVKDFLHTKNLFGKKKK